MNIQRDFLPKLVVQESKDETLSYTGKQDFTPDEPEIKTLLPRGRNTRPRTRASMLNSYT